MSGIQVEVDLKHLGILTRNLHDGSQQLVRVSFEVMSKALQVAVVYAKQNLSGQILGTRTGFLRNSIRSQITIDHTEGLVGRLGLISSSRGKVNVYGAAQEFGGEAKPIAPRKVMTIPLAAALTPAGVTRFTALEAKQRFDRTFWKHDVLYGVKKSKAARRGKDKIIPLFAAATHVKIGKGPGKGRAFLRNARDRILPDFRDAVGRRLADILLSRRG